MPQNVKGRRWRWRRRRQRVFPVWGSHTYTTGVCQHAGASSKTKVLQFCNIFQNFHEMYKKFISIFYFYRLSDKINLQLIKLADHTKQSQVGSSPLVIPALLETISRILLWTGTKNFQCNLLTSNRYVTGIIFFTSAHVIPNVFRLQVWSMLQSMLEVVSFRVHTQISTHLRFQFVQLLNSVAGVSIIPAQLFIW